MLWIKAFHIISMTTWFAGLFYLPRLFVYHVNTQDEAGHLRFVTMERKLFGIMTIGMLLTILLGVALLGSFPKGYVSGATWLHIKLAVVALLFAYHMYCAALMRTFRLGQNQRSERWYRLFNEVPALALIAIVILVVVKPIF